MTPADGGRYPDLASRSLPLTVSGAVLLHGGRAILLFQDCVTPPPRTGDLVRDSGVTSWTSESWRVVTDGHERWHGLAIVSAVASPGDELRGADGCDFLIAGRFPLDVAPDPLVDLVRKAGANCREVFSFMMRALLTQCEAGSAEARAHLEFARGFFMAAAERDGFIEVLAAPDTGGVFAQGWSMSLGEGVTAMVDLSQDLTLQEVEVAVFDRDDILATANGVCFFGKHWRQEQLEGLEAVFFELDGRLLRLDVLSASVLHLRGKPATAHVAQMLPRLIASDGTCAAFKRVCRPRFAGIDSLAGTSLPVAAGFDAILIAPDGGLLTIGWLLDPTHRVRQVLLKSTSDLYSRLDTSWIPSPRPDLVEAYQEDPRFSGLLDSREFMHGFIAHTPACREAIEGGQFYLELFLDDDSCLFQPLSATPFSRSERLPHILRAVSHGAPELEQIVEDHLAPFLDGVLPTAPAKRRGDRQRPIRLGAETAREVSAVMPFQAFAELQPVFTLLSGSPDAELIELILVTDRRTASETLPKLKHAFTFYGLQGALVICADNENRAARIDLGVSSSLSRSILCWSPSVLPKHEGWLAAMLREADALDGAGLLSPALTYEDGSIYFGGERLDQIGGACALVGYGSGRLHRGGPRPSASGAMEMALIARDILEHAGGFAGHLFGDGFAHVDLADRLAAAGHGTWCSGSVELWMLDDELKEPTDLETALIRKIDCALIGRRRRTLNGGSS